MPDPITPADNPADTAADTAADNPIGHLIDEQMELAASRLPALQPGVVHPSPVDHEERTAAHADFEAVLLGTAEPTPEMLEELAALGSAPPLSDEELARQALADGGADGDTTTPE